MNEEKLNVVDDAGKIIGIETRENIHNNGLLHCEVHVWLFNNKKEIIFQKRSSQKDTYPGLLDASVGGHVEIGDDNETTAIKEVKEETGLNVNKEDLIFIKQVRRKSFDEKTNKINNVIRSVFALKFEGDINDLKIEEEMATGFKFFSIEKILNLSEEEKKEFIASITDEESLEIYKKIASLI